jgi:hypothetical protein
MTKISTLGIELRQYIQHNVSSEDMANISEVLNEHDIKYGKLRECVNSIIERHYDIIEGKRFEGDVLIELYKLARQTLKEIDKHGS